MNCGDFELRCQSIRVVISDVDGVLTDGGMYYTEHGDEIKKFSIRDGVGVALLQASGIAVGAMTGEATTLVIRRMKKMGMQFALAGIRNKRDALAMFLTKHGYRPEEVAYVGDEVNDFPLLGETRIFFAPKDACREIKNQADCVLNTPGGAGVLREIAELLLDARGEYASALERYCSKATTPTENAESPAGYDDLEGISLSDDSSLGGSGT